MISYYRTKLLQIAKDKKFSNKVIREIMLLFRDVPPEKKEDVAKWLCPIFMMIKTDEATAIMETKKAIERLSIVFTNRNKFLRTLQDMGWSQQVKHDVMCLFSPLISHEEKEQVAGLVVPLLGNCKTREDVVTVTSKMVQQVLSER